MAVIADLLVMFVFLVSVRMLLLCWALDVFDVECACVCECVGWLLEHGVCLCVGVLGVRVIECCAWLCVERVRSV